MRFDAAAIQPTQAIQDQWQLLDLRLLQHDPWKSIWYLHSQPPLYNAFCSLVLQLPRAMQVPIAASCFLALGLAFAASTYLLAVKLALPLWASAVLALAVVANPATILYENWLSWTYPAAVFVTGGAYLLVCYLRNKRWGWGLSSFACFAAVLLDDSVFQWIWLAALLLVLLLFTRFGWRRILAVSVLPLLIVAGWYVKDAVLFGTDTTSSWIGMNLASTTLGVAPPSQLRAMVHSGTLTPIALDAPFSGVNVFVPKYVKLHRTGVAALDEQYTANGGINFNNLAYIAVSNQYLSNDMNYIKRHPMRYLSNALTGLQIWMVPADQYAFLTPNFTHIARYARLYDSGVLWQAMSAPTQAPGLRPSLGGPPPGKDELSYFKILEYTLAILVLPIMIFSRRRDRVMAGILAVIWTTIVYDLLATSLISLGDNNRFSFEVGALPLVAAASAALFIIDWVRGRRSMSRIGPQSPS
ncbi:MAG: hypothetical protein ACYDHU_05550 [Acidimicrobiales bacterium]